MTGQEVKAGHDHLMCIGELLAVKDEGTLVCIKIVLAIVALIEQLRDACLSSEKRRV